MRFAAIGLIVIAANVGAETPDHGFYVGADLAGLDVHAGREFGMLFGSPQGTIPRVIERVLPETAHAHGADVVWSGQFGYRINRFLAFELAYMDFGSIIVSETYDPPPFTQFPGIFESDIRFEASGPSLSGLGRVPLGERLEAFVRVGVVHAEQAIERSLRAVLPGESAVEHASDDVPLYGIGASYKLSSDWSIRLECQQVDDLHGSDKIDGISSLGPMRIRRYGLGMTYQF